MTGYTCLGSFLAYCLLVVAFSWISTFKPTLKMDSSLLRNQPEKVSNLTAVGTMLRFALIDAYNCNYWLWFDQKTFKSKGSLIIA